MTSDLFVFAAIGGLALASIGHALRDDVRRLTTTSCDPSPHQGSSPSRVAPGHTGPANLTPDSWEDGRPSELDGVETRDAHPLGVPTSRATRASAMRTCVLGRRPWRSGTLNKNAPVAAGTARGHRTSPGGSIQ